MKKYLLILLSTASLCMMSQNTTKDVFTSKSIIWYGLNFSEAKMVGQFDQAMGGGIATPEMLKTKWMSSWNGLIISEPKNFKILESFKKEDVFFDIGPTEALNQAIKNEELMAYNPFTFKDAQSTIKNLVSKTTGGEKKDGIGVLFVVESFNKTIDEAAVYVVIFDIKTKNVLVSEKIIGKPMGIGLRNFWAGAIKHILKQIDSDYYSSWKSKAK